MAGMRRQITLHAWDVLKAQAREELVTVAHVMRARGTDNPSVSHGGQLLLTFADGSKAEYRETLAEYAQLVSAAAD
jgi:hypothetical protein